MSRYICICGYIYDEAAGIPEAGIPAGTKWSDLPKDWTCPLCGSPKSMFSLIEEEGSPEPEQKKEPASKRIQSMTGEGIEVPAGYGGDDLREMTYAEVAALCSNLAKGCEKQCLVAESKLFMEISDYYMKRAEPIKDASVEKLIELINVSLKEDFPESENIAKSDKDRGALRVLTWSGKVTKILQGLMDRWDSEGDFFKGTNVYVCDICGFIYVGDVPPEICPICKVPSMKLIKVSRK